MLGEDEVSPDQPVEEDRCPKCNRKALSPRVRTNDFRCSGCNTTFSKEEVDEAIGRAHEERLAVLLSQFVIRSIPNEPRLDDPESNSAVPGCMGLLAIPAGLALGVMQVPAFMWAALPDGWLARIGVGLALGIVGFLATLIGLGRLHLALLRRDARSAYVEELLDLDRWKREQPTLNVIREAVMASGEESDCYQISRMSPPLRQAYDDAIRQTGYPDAALYERLRNEVERRFPLSASAEPYRTS